VSISIENAPVHNVIQLNFKKIQVNLQKDYLQVIVILDYEFELIFRIECVFDALSLSGSDLKEDEDILL